MSCKLVNSKPFTPVLCAGRNCKQSILLLVRTEFVTGHVPKNLSVGRTLKEHVAADQQLTRMGIADAEREFRLLCQRSVCGSPQPCW